MRHAEAFETERDNIVLSKKRTPKVVPRSFIVQQARVVSLPMFPPSTAPALRSSCTPPPHDSQDSRRSTKNKKRPYPGRDQGASCSTWLWYNNVICCQFFFLNFSSCLVFFFGYWPEFKVDKIKKEPTIKRGDARPLLSFFVFFFLARMKLGWSSIVFICARVTSTFQFRVSSGLHKARTQTRYYTEKHASGNEENGIADDDNLPSYQHTKKPPKGQAKLSLHFRRKKIPPCRFVSNRRARRKKSENSGGPP